MRKEAQKIAEKNVAALRGILLNAKNRVAFTTDMWTSKLGPANENYLSLTAHLVDANWNISTVQVIVTLTYNKNMTVIFLLTYGMMWCGMVLYGMLWCGMNHTV